MARNEPSFLEELAGLPTFAHPAASPDGNEVALYSDVSGRNELYLLDVGTGEMEQLTDGEIPRNVRWGIAWATDGARVFVHLDEGGDEQNDIHAVDRGGNIEPVVETGGLTSIEDVGQDGETLLFSSTAGGQKSLYTCDLPSGETTELTDHDRATRSGELSPDCDRVAYATNETDDAGNQDVYVAPVDGSTPRNLRIGGTGAESSPADWHPDGRRLLVSDNTRGLSRCGVYDVDADEVTWYGDLEHRESPVRFLPDGERFLALRTRECEIVTVSYDLETGAATELDLPGGVASLVSDPVLDAERVLIVHSTPTSRPELLCYDLTADESRVLVEAEYGDVDPEIFVDPTYFTFRSDGVPETRAAAVDHDPYESLEIEALLYDSGRRPSPLVVNPHGGPRTADYRLFTPNTQFLVSRGYSVLKVNYRGSSGRGRAFVEHLYGDWGGAEQGDIAVGVEHVLATRDWIDEDRIAVCGGSFGGYAALWQLVQYPDLYDAGIAWTGIADLSHMYENTMPHFRTELLERHLGTPDENPGLYRERSPVTHAGNLDAPVLVVHAANDRRIPVLQARILRDALEEVDVEYEYEELREVGHASSGIDLKTRMFRLFGDFLERRVGPGT